MEGSNIKYNSNSNIKNNLKFILPSLLGIILFMIPIKYNDQITIPVAIFSNALVKMCIRDSLQEYMLVLL